MKQLRRALQNGPSPMAIRHSWQKLFKVFSAPTQRERSIIIQLYTALAYMYIHVYYSDEQVRTRSFLSNVIPPSIWDTNTLIYK